MTRTYMWILIYFTKIIKYIFLIQYKKNNICYASKISYNYLYNTVNTVYLKLYKNRSNLKTVDF